MKKFSKLLESIQLKNYKVEANIELIIEAENEGEAGYISDSLLGDIKEQFSYSIINIEETSENIKENIQEQNLSARGDRETKLKEEKEIEMSWEKEFGDSEPTQTEKAEWYHQMRLKGYDGMLIFNVIGDRFSGNEN